MDTLPESVSVSLTQYAETGATAAIIGHGAFGSLVRKFLLARGMTVLICDPPQERAVSEEEYEDTMTQWGNGMGGCLTKRDDDSLVYLPLKNVLFRADLVCIQVPKEAHDSVIHSPDWQLRKNAVVLDFTGQ